MGIPMNDSNLISRLNAIRATDKFDTQVIDQFAEFITTAPDEELFHMSPLRYAEHANAAQETAVDLFLYATHAGILDFNWGVLCPSCGAFLTKKSGLRWLHTKKHCSLCQLDTTPSIDEQIEIAFTISPAVRSIRFHNVEKLEFERDGFFTFFSTSVALHPEIHQIVYSSVQAGFRIPPVSTHEIKRTFESNHYLLMVPTTHAVAHIPVNDSQAPREVEFELLFDGQLVPEIQPKSPAIVSFSPMNNVWDAPSSTSS